MTIKRFEVEKEENWREWCQKIPYIKFKKEWNIKLIPPFAGAMVRFLIEMNNKNVSVYLDCYDGLGYFGEPYWEVYHVDDYVGRVAMNDVDGLMALIETSLNEN